MQFDKTKHSTKYQPTLSHALQFTESDLTANQQGFITTGQVDFLKRHLIWKGCSFILISVTSLVVLLVIEYNLIVGGSQQRDEALQFYGLAIFFLIAGFFGLIALGYLFVDVLDVYRDIKERRIAAAEGWANLNIYNYRAGLKYHEPKYRLNISDQRFVVDQKTFLAFKNNDPYRLHYAPRSKILLSAEWLRDDPFLPE